MSSSSDIQDSLEEINKTLKDVQDRREKLIKGTRDVVMLCSKSIVAMHHSELEDAKSKMDQAKTMLEEFRKYARQDLYRYITVAEQELVEAYALKSVMDNKPMPYMRGCAQAKEKMPRNYLQQWKRSTMLSTRLQFTIILCPGSARNSMLQGC